MVPAATGDTALASEHSEFFFGQNGARAVLILYYIALTLVLTASLVGLMTAITVIITLGSWLTETEDKLVWLKDYVTCLLLQAVSMEVATITLAFMVVFGALLTSPLLGCMSFIVFLSVLAFTFVFFQPNVGRTRGVLHKRARAALSKNVRESNMGREIQS